MNCIKCNAQIEDGAEFCPGCGQKVYIHSEAAGQLGRASRASARPREFSIGRNPSGRENVWQ